MRWTRRLRLCTAGLVTASALFALPTAQAAEPRDGQLTDLVNPFIGTENEGNTYPGAAVPFGMVQFSPDTGHNTGYDHSQNHIRGFSSSISRASAAVSAATCPSCPPPGTSRGRTTRSTRPSSATTPRKRTPAPTRSA